MGDVADQLPVLLLILNSIINADNKVDVTQEFVRYSVKPHKFFIFNKETEERIYFEVE